MTATDIIAAIIGMHKNHDCEDVAELLASRAAIADFPFIKEELEPHVSSNETNACDDAIAWIDAYFARAA